MDKKRYDGMTNNGKEIKDLFSMANSFSGISAYFSSSCFGWPEFIFAGWPPTNIEDENLAARVSS